VQQHGETSAVSFSLSMKITAASQARAKVPKARNGGLRILRLENGGQARIFHAFSVRSASQSDD